MDGNKTYAEMGIPGLVPCPSWCTLDHASASWEPDVGPGRAEIYHGGIAIGGVVPVGEDLVRVGLGWAGRFADGAWQPPQATDITVFLQSGTDAITFEATEHNMAGLAAIARLISPEVEERAWKLARQVDILDGKIVSSDRCHEKTVSRKGREVDLWYSGKKGIAGEDG